MEQTLTPIRTKQTESLLHQLSTAIEQWKQRDLQNALCPTNLQQMLSDLDRARRQFDSKLFFVVVFGPLKAGKSTLANALAGEYVSPAGFGKETTRRPSLVIRDNDSGIDQYFSTDPDINHFLSQRRVNRQSSGGQATEDEADKVKNVRQAFDNVADYLRGIRNKDEFAGRIRVTTSVLNPANLETALTQELATEPLLTVIRCKGGHLLSNGVAIVDMPGLDGSRSNWREDPIHEWVIKRAEFFIFVQSSVAAWNLETRDFVRQVLAQSTRPPIWLVQNIFDARHWQPEEKRKKAEEDQREEGKKRVLELLDEAPRAVLGLNIGLAWDGKKEANELWLSKSTFPDFEAQLTQVLHAERALIQERNCLENLRQQFKNAREIRNTVAQSVASLRQQHKAVRDKLEEAIARLDGIDYRSDWESAVRTEMSTIAEESVKPWLEALNVEFANLNERHNRTRTGKEVNEELAIAGGKLGSEGSTRHFAKSLLFPRYLKAAAQYCKSAESDAVARCNQLLAELQMPELPAPLAPSPEDMPSLSEEKFSSQNLQEKKRFLGLPLDSWINKTHDGHFIITCLQEVAKDWRGQIGTRKDCWFNQLLNNHFSGYCEKRKQHYRAHLLRLRADFDAKAGPREDLATATERLLDEAAKEFACLEQPLADAWASMK